MSACCTPEEIKPVNSRKRCCPDNGLEGVEVSAKTISHHLKHPWTWKDNGARYFFCGDPECNVVYFGDDDSVITRQQLRTVVGVKDYEPEAPVCYCFGVSRADAMSNPAIRDYVVSQTKHQQCSCEVSNPSGRCCLKDFPRSGKQAE